MKKIIPYTLIFLLGASLVQAQIRLYTDRSLFIQDLDQYGFHIINLEALKTGTILPELSGDTLIMKQRFRLTPYLPPASFSPEGTPFIVDNTFFAPSGNHYLGLEGDRAFLSGDRIDISFDAPVHAIGCFIIGEANDIWKEDFTLLAGSGAVKNADSPEMVLPDAGEVFFLGIIETDPGLQFSTAALESLAQDYEFHLDDILIGTTTPLDPDPDADCDVDGKDLYVLAITPFTSNSLVQMVLGFGRMSPCPAAEHPAHGTGLD